jgi:hypothetical protein
VTRPSAGSVWLLWEWPFLRGIYASRDDADNVADALRAKLVKRAPFTHAVNVRVDERQVHAATSAKPDPARVRVRALTERIAKGWGLVSARDAQAGEIFAVERYLAVPHDGVLAFPAFQFGPDGRPTDEFVTVLAHLHDAGWDDIAIATWFATSNDVLDGQSPADAIGQRPAAVAMAAHTDTGV